MLSGLFLKRPCLLLSRRYTKQAMTDNMTKPRLIAAEIMRKRKEEKLKDKSCLILNRAYLQILGSDCQGFNPSLLVMSEGNLYLFNCGAGLQRFCFSNKIKLTNLENVFLTKLDWKNLAGFFGLSLTLQDVGLPSISICATDGIKDLFKACYTFLTFTTGMECLTRTDLDGDYKDSGINVHSITISDEFSISTQDDVERHNKRVKSSSKLIAYVCTFPDLPGALDPKKCQELKVPVGRQLAILKSGKDIELEDGRIVKSIDVCSPKSLGLHFLVVECPSESHIDQIVNNPELSMLRKYRSSNRERQIDLIVHFSPNRVMTNPRFIDWIDGFDINCKHLVVSNTERNRINFDDSYRLQYLLRKLDDEIFHPLSLPEELARRVEEELKNSAERPAKIGEVEELLEMQHRFNVIGDLDSMDRVIKVNSFDKFNIRPNKYVEATEPIAAIDILYRDALIDPAFSEHLSELRKLQQNLPKPKDYEPEIVFLGTGSALPSKLRNTSCILLNFSFPKDLSIIMDCGEDSYGQLHRFYGPGRAAEVLRRLKLIYISHHHPDHHIGLIELLRQRKKLTNEPCLLLLPPGIDNLLRYHNKNFEDLSDTYEIFSTKAIRTKPAGSKLHMTALNSLKNDLYDKLGGFLFDIELIGVEHCLDACAVVMRLKIGRPEMETFTVCYSGDARPCKEFAIAGKDCDLLVHEATFDFRSEKDAKLKKHSTSSEAIDVARQMNAKFTILTHFSQRLPKIPYFTNEFDEKIGFAFDNLCLKCPSQFPRLPILKPVLMQAFKKQIDENDFRFMKQESKQQMIESIIASQQTGDMN